MNVSLSPDLRTFIDERVATGGFASTSEYVRSLIRRDRDESTLRNLLLEGARSPAGPVADDAYFDRLRGIARS